MRRRLELGTVAILLSALGCWTPPTTRWAHPPFSIRTYCRPVAHVPIEVEEGTFLQTREGRELRSYGADDGRPRWTLGFGADCVLTYARAESIVAVVTRGGQQPSPTSTEVVSVDPHEGRKRWTTPMNAYPLRGLPVIDSRRAYLVTRRHRDVYLGMPQGSWQEKGYEPDHRVQAFALASGTHSWSSPIPTPDGWSPIMDFQIISDNRTLFVYARFANQNQWTLSGFDANSGERLWVIPSNYRDAAFDPTYRRGWIGLLSDGRILHLRPDLEIRDPRTGALIDSPHLAPEVQRAVESRTSQLMHDDALYVFSTQHDEAMRIDLPAGTEKWRRRFQEKKNWKGVRPGTIPVRYRDGLVSLGAEDGNIYVLRADTGEMVGYVDPHRSFERAGRGWPVIPYAGGVLTGVSLIELRKPWFQSF